MFPDAEKPPYKIHVVSTHDENRPRTVYDHARTEKEARGAAYARARRMLGKDSFVILDGMNYIKGYRYQLWCEAKALGTTCCVVCFFLLFLLYFHVHIEVLTRIPTGPRRNTNRPMRREQRSPA